MFVQEWIVASSLVTVVVRVSYFHLGSEPAILRKKNTIVFIIIFFIFQTYVNT